MTLLGRINWLISRLEDSLLIGLVAALLLVAVAQIVLRNALGEGLLWAEPAMRIAVLWIAMIGAMVACREGGHIKINLLEVYARGSAPIKRRACLCQLAVCELRAHGWHDHVFEPARLVV